MTTRSFDPSEIKIIRCPYCGDESRATSGWVHSRMAFQCGGCGEKVSLHETKFRKVFRCCSTKAGRDDRRVGRHQISRPRVRDAFVKLSYNRSTLAARK